MLVDIILPLIFKSNQIYRFIITNKILSKYANYASLLTMQSQPHCPFILIIFW
jgi:hypothetical protein